MENPKNLAFGLARKWVLLILMIGIMDLVDFGRSTVDQTSPNLLCISDCATCPVICSPPPPPSSSSESSPPPPSHHHSPPQSYYFPSAPPLASPSPPPPPTPSPPPPSPFYFSWTDGPPPSSPVFTYNPVTEVPPGMPQRNYSFPYYYFYTSKASPFVFRTSLSLILLLSLHVMFFCR